MKKLYLNRISPFLHLKTALKNKPKSITDKKSRNGSSFHGINDIKLKELLTTYLQTQPSQALSCMRSEFCSFDKHNQITQVPFNPDINYMKHKKLYPQQMRMRNNKRRQSSNNYNKGNQIGNKRYSNHVKTESMFDFVNVLKPHNAHRSREGNNNTVMNIVNNLNGDALSQTSRGNKNVEINFNKYEIRILSNKKESSDSKQIEAIKECVSKNIENQNKDNYQINKKKDNINNVIIVQSDKESNENIDIGQTITKENEDKNEVMRSHVLFQQSEIENENENDNSDGDENIFCLKQPKKVAQLLHRNNSILKNNNKGIITQSIKKSDIKPINDIRNNNRESGINGVNADTTFDARINSNDKCNVNNTTMPIKTQPQFICSMSISNQNTFSLKAKENIMKIIPITEKKLKLSIKVDTIKTEANRVLNNNYTDNNCNTNSTSNIVKQSSDTNDNTRKLTTPSSCVPKLKLNANYNRMSSPTKRSVHSKDDDSSVDNKNTNSPLSSRSKFWRKKKKLLIQTDMNNGTEPNNPSNRNKSKIIDSSDISQDDEDTHPILTRQVSSSVNSNFILNNLQVKNLKRDLANQDHTSTEATNTYSTKNSSEIMKAKDNSAYLFLLKRTKSNTLSSRNSVCLSNPLKLKLAMSPKKNKRFLKQLSRISEISNKKNKNQKKDRLIKSISLPLISMDKLSNILQCNKPSRQLTTMNVNKTKQLLSLCHHNSFEINQKNVIKEEEQLSDNHHSKDSSFSSSVSNRTKSEMKKKPSVLSNSTGGINFFEMKASSIQINTNLSKCFSQDNRTHYLSFIEKFIEEVKIAQNDIDLYSTEAKNDLLHKTMLTIDLKCEQLEDQRRKTYNQFANDTISNLMQLSQLNQKDFIKKTSQIKSTGIVTEIEEEEGDFKEETDTFNEYDHYFNILDVQLSSEQSILSFSLFENYFEIDILNSIERDHYFENNNYDGNMSIIGNFSKTKKVYKKLKTSLSIRNNKSIKKTVTFRITQQKGNVPIINLFEYFRFIQKDDVPLEDKTDQCDYCALNPTTKMSSLTPQKTYKRNESKIFLKKRTTAKFKKCSTPMTISSMKSIDDRKDSVLQRKFYLRHRDSLNNYE